MVPSPDVLSYKATPRMGLPKITARILQALRSKRYDFIAANVSNADMLAHTGSIKAAVLAIECIDKCLGIIVTETLAHSGTVVITGDHGNAEELVNRRTGEIDTEHSANPVPLIIIRPGTAVRLRKSGKLADVAPTILELMGVRKPESMTGKSLLV